MFIFPVQLTTSRIGNLTRLIHTLLYVMTIHTYIHTHIQLFVSIQCIVSYRRYFQHDAHFMPTVDVGKRGAY